jgi:hypothetical protein
MKIVARMLVGLCLIGAAACSKKVEIYDKPATAVDQTVGEADGAFSVKVSYPTDAFEPDTLLVMPGDVALKEKGSVFGDTHIKLRATSSFPESLEQAEKDAIGIQLGDKMTASKKEKVGEHGFLIVIENDKKSKVEVHGYIPSTGDHGIECTGSHSDSKPLKDGEKWTAFFTKICQSVTITKAPAAVASAAAAEGKAPDGWPADVPLYKGRIKNVSNSSSDYSDSYSLSISTTDAADVVQTFYETQLKAKGFKQNSNSNSGGSVTRSYGKKYTDPSVTVSTSVFQGATTVFLSVSVPKKKK